MKKSILSLIAVVCTYTGFTQQTDTTAYSNLAGSMMANNSKLTIGGYAQIDYNQPYKSGEYSLGTLDVHRMVLMFGYKFNQRAQFITELEMEHVSEVYVEQAFLNYQVNSFLNFRAGLLLVPMGISNEYHEPTTFNGVERPVIDEKISPTTWREIGFGLTGTVPSASFKYQLYVINGFNGYDADKGALLSGPNGLRSGRQKGAESYMSSPNVTCRAEYFGFKGLNLGLSGYAGNTQSYLFKGLDKTDEAARAQADSSVVTLAMVGLDARYTFKGLQLKGQFYYTGLKDADRYNAFTGKDLGSALMGYYAEACYNVFRNFSSIESGLVPFIRFEHYNMHQKVGVTETAKDALNVNVLTTGLGWKITTGSMLKADVQMVKSKADSEYVKTFNAGVAIMF
ncbi:MAG: hypothetical protein M0P66_04005 [Salinivirgaceae bacterium]|nr:hypothetical protein [Salinivirgaceae bacterium]